MLKGPFPRNTKGVTSATFTAGTTLAVIYASSCDRASLPIEPMLNVTIKGLSSHLKM